MAFLANVKSLSLYPKENNLLIYAVLEQKGKIVKGVIRCGLPELMLLAQYGRLFRFVTDKSPSSSYYKQMTVPMFEIKSFTVMDSSKQPTITNTLLPKDAIIDAPLHQISQQRQPQAQQMDIDME